MSKKVEVEKVTVRIGEKTIELTLEEAKSLREVLNSLFETAKAVPAPIIVLPHVPNHVCPTISPSYPGYYPSYPQNPSPIWYGGPTITCTSGGSTSQNNLGGGIVD